MPGVDPDRTAVTGISWGGYLTCIAASIDPRFKAAVPVYGCGFLHEDSCWRAPWFDKMKPGERDRWIALYDPSRYLPACRVPIFFVNGTNDFAYPLDSYMKSYRLVKGPKSIRVTVNMPHGHPEGWAPREIGLFIDERLRGGQPLPRAGELKASLGVAAIEYDAKAPPAAVELHFTAGTGPINQREWKTVAMKLDGGRAAASLPADATVWFATVADGRGAVVSSEVAILK
jgi:PhoPQ-activated pathogenicity-related protein